jgi:hypothetical protein
MKTNNNMLSGGKLKPQYYQYTCTEDHTLPVNDTNQDHA